MYRTQHEGCIMYLSTWDNISTWWVFIYSFNYYFNPKNNNSNSSRLSWFIYASTTLWKSAGFQEFQVWNSGTRSWVPYPVTESVNQGLECWQGWLILLISTVWSGKKNPNLCYQHVSQWMSGIIAAIIQYHTQRHSTHTACWIQCTWPCATLTAFGVVTQWFLLCFFLTNAAIRHNRTHCVIWVTSYDACKRKTVPGWSQWPTTFPVRSPKKVDVVLSNIK